MYICFHFFWSSVTVDRGTCRVWGLQWAYDRKSYLPHAGEGFPLNPEIFYIMTQWSCITSGLLWEMPDSNPDRNSSPERHSLYSNPLTTKNEMLVDFLQLDPHGKLSSTLFDFFYTVHISLSSPRTCEIFLFFNSSCLLVWRTTIMKSTLFAVLFMRNSDPLGKVTQIWMKEFNFLTVRDCSARLL